MIIHTTVASRQKPTNRNNWDHHYNQTYRPGQPVTPVIGPVRNPLIPLAVRVGGAVLVAMVILAVVYGCL